MQQGLATLTDAHLEIECHKLCKVLGPRSVVKYWAQGGVFETTGVILWWDSSGWGGPEAEKTAKQTESTHSWEICDSRV